MRKLLLLLLLGANPVLAEDAEILWAHTGFLTTTTDIHYCMPVEATIGKGTLSFGAATDLCSTDPTAFDEFQTGVANYNVPAAGNSWIAHGIIAERGGKTYVWNVGGPPSASPPGPCAASSPDTVRVGPGVPPGTGVAGATIGEWSWWKSTCFRQVAATPLTVAQAKTVATDWAPPRSGPYTMANPIISFFDLEAQTPGTGLPTIRPYFSFWELGGLPMITVFSSITVNGEARRLGPHASSSAVSHTHLVGICETSACGVSIGAPGIAGQNHYFVTFLVKRP